MYNTFQYVNRAREIASNFGLECQDVVTGRMSKVVFSFTDPDTKKVITSPVFTHQEHCEKWLDGFEAAGILAGWPQ